MNNFIKIASIWFALFVLVGLVVFIASETFFGSLALFTATFCIYIYYRRIKIKHGRK
jgi:hypothetical protein